MAKFTATTLIQTVSAVNSNIRFQPKIRSYASVWGELTSFVLGEESAEGSESDWAADVKSTISRMKVRWIIADNRLLCRGR